MQKLQIKIFEVDNNYEGLLMIKSVEPKVAKTGKEYYQVILSDGDTDLPANFFTPTAGFDYKSLVGKIITAKLKTQLYNGGFSCIIDGIDDSFPITAEIKKQFIKFSSSYEYYTQCCEDLKNLLEEIKDEEIKKICTHVFLEKYEKEFRTYPAAKSNHHTGCGGLLEHSLSLAKQALSAAKHYSYDGYTFDTDLLIAGALFQDIGKIVEFHVDELYNATYSAIGNIKGHITISNEILYESLYDLNINPRQDKIAKLSHIILSHHGKIEYGSPSTPKTPEAILIAGLDHLDANMKSAIATIKSTKETEEFTARIFALENTSILMPKTKIFIVEETSNSITVEEIDVTTTKDNNEEDLTNDGLF